MTRVLRLVLFGAALSLLVVVATAEAEAARGQKKFKKVLKEATAAFKIQDFEDSLDLFRQAYRLNPDVRLLFNVGRSLEQLGRLQEALTAFQQCVKGNPPPEVAGRAKEKIRLLQTQLSSGRVVLLVVPVGAEASVDGKSIGKAPFAPLDVKPGPHVLVVQHSGYDTDSRRFEVPPGGEVTVRVDLNRQPAAEPVGKPGGTDGDPTIVAERGLSPWNWVMVGTGGAMLVAGAAVLALGFVDHAELESSDRDSPGFTYAEARALQDKGNLEKTAGIALVGLGSAVAVTGIVLFFVPSRPGEPEGGGTAFSRRGPTLGLSPFGGCTFTLGGSF